MYINQAQKCLTYMGYYANGFARHSSRNIERITRPMPQGNAYWPECAERVKRVFITALFIPFAVALLIPAFTCYALAAGVGRGRFELIKPNSPVSPLNERSIKVMSLNAAFQDPWAPLTAGVVPPLEPVARCMSRVAAVAEAIGQEDPDVYLGQEFENLGAQDECIRQLRQKGFHYFVRDLGSSEPIRNSSGLFVASKVPLHNIEFAAYPSEDRVGLAKWSSQGALTFTVALGEQNLRLVNVHLNYGDGEENQAARNRQLKRHVVPLLQRGNAALFGDLNFDTASVEPEASGLTGFVNALEGEVTCTNRGKETLRGAPADGEQSIDGLIYDPKQIQVINSCAKQLMRGNLLLSDHYATVAVLKI